MGAGPMMGERQMDQPELFYGFSLERHVPADHLLRSIDRFVDLGDIRAQLRPFYSDTGRPSIDPELMIRMLIIGYCMGIRSERRLCNEVHLNLAYRWFCRLGLDGAVPDHCTFSKNRHGRFRDSDLLRHLFEETVARCIAEGLVGGEGFAVDASMIKADANRQNSTPGDEWEPPNDPEHAVREYLSVLDEAAFGGATSVVSKFISGSDPASRWTGANGGLAFFAYWTNYLIDLKHAVIMDVEATTAVRQAEVTAQRVMLDRTQERFGIWSERLAADTAMARPRTSPGWSTRRVSSRTARCSRSRRAKTASSPGPTSPMIMRTTATSVPAASGCGNGRRSIARTVRSSMRTA
jgi:transposase